jgi:PncC family amidohydrolase
MMSDDNMGLLDQLKKKLIQCTSTVSAAESCTGGILATWLTQLPGSSTYYLGGVSAYANQLKIDILHVSRKSLEDHGAVSAQVAQEMAKGIQRLTGSTHALALTGIAGPDGGTPTKPVGTVYCGLASPEGVTSFLWQISGDRAMIRQEAALRALKALKESLTP